MEGNVRRWWVCPGLVGGVDGSVGSRQTAGLATPCPVIERAGQRTEIDAARGPGEFLGTRQAGLVALGVADLVRDADILIEARQQALDYLEDDAELTAPEAADLRDALARRSAAGGQASISG